jgi:peptide-methionine (S)-S-oxide reductase
MQNRYLLLTVAALAVAALTVVLVQGWILPRTSGSPDPIDLARSPSDPPPGGFQQATFGSGCFWCTQVLFQQLNGVHSAVSGYSGGSLKNPTYDQVCTGTTGHAEVVQVTFDPAVISFADLLEVFWKTHDPTTRNRQGGDIGPQYRSVIFYHTAEQQKLAEQYKRKLDASGAFPAAIVTEIEPFTRFYPAEEYHQNYYLDHPGQPYCALTIGPKLDKFTKVFASKLRPQQRQPRGGQD